MNSLKELEHRLKSITGDKWQELFDLIPKMEQAISFGEVRGGEQIDENTFATRYWHPAPVVDDFFRLTNALGIVPVFDWVNWTKGRELLSDPNTDYETLPAITLCKLLTVIFRTERFSEGFLVNCFQKGIILGILKGLRGKVL